ncbi:hypothetical protein Lesp01_81840 [Lentzea sp. NBRC 102530]|nr:hypothetical protein Lesp01_81840 [Lentzea sp. NBRC 102530]
MVDLVRGLRRELIWPPVVLVDDLIAAEHHGVMCRFARRDGNDADADQLAGGQPEVRLVVELVDSPLGVEDRAVPIGAADISLRGEVDANGELDDSVGSLAGASHFERRSHDGRVVQRAKSRHRVPTPALRRRSARETFA